MIDIFMQKGKVESNFFPNNYSDYYYFIDYDYVDYYLLDGVA